MAPTAENNIIYGGPLEGRVTKGEKSLGEFYLNRFQELGDKIVLIDALNDFKISANKIRENAIEVARNLRALGVKEGDVVSICSENRLEFTYAAFAAILLNATLAPLNSTYTERELLYAISLSKPKVIFASSSTIKQVKAAAQKNSCVRFMVNFDEDSPSWYILGYSRFLKLHKEKTIFKAKPTNMHETVAIILSSSGTTGLPKGVQITQANLLFSIDCQFGVRTFIWDATALSVIPWSHAYGLQTMMNLLVIGAKCVFLAKFQEKPFLETIQKYGVNVCLLVPPLMVFLAKHPMIDQYDLSSLKVLLCGAAPLSKSTEDEVRSRIGVPIIRQGYGLSEATLSVLSQNDDYCKAGSVGTVRKGIYAKVVDTESGKVLGPNQRGELYFKGPLLMKGYIGDEQATKQTIDKDGWLHTGDIGYYDEGFNFFIVDRLKELIKYKGYQVPPAEIEALLLTHPKISDAAVVGKPDEAFGELPVAFVVRKDSSLTQKDVIDFVAGKVSPAKRLHGGVRFVEEIPKNQAGKILRRVLRKTLKRELKSKL